MAGVAEENIISTGYQMSNFEISKKAQKKFIKETGSDKIYEDQNFALLRLKNVQAAELYGAGTRWCIVKPTCFYSYSIYAPLYVLFDKRFNKKFCINFWYGEYRNEANQQQKLSTVFIDYPFLLDVPDICNSHINKLIHSSELERTVFFNSPYYNFHDSHGDFIIAQLGSEYDIIQTLSSASGELFCKKINVYIMCEIFKREFEKLNHELLMNYTINFMMEKWLVDTGRHEYYYIIERSGSVLGNYYLHTRTGSQKKYSSSSILYFEEQIVTQMIGKDPL